MARGPDFLPQDAPVGTVNGLVKPYPFFATPSPPYTTTLSEGELLRELRTLIVGYALPFQTDSKRPQVLGRNDDEFTSSTTIFNGAVKTHAIAVVKPTNAHDVSQTIKFCRAHGLEMSVKGGGNGVHGWSVAGHIVLDLSLMNDVNVSRPDPQPPSLQESFDRLRIQRDSFDSSSTEAPRRPSLASTHAGSSESGFKRSAQDAMDNVGLDDGTDQDGSRGKRKIHDGQQTFSPMDVIGEDGSDAEMSRNSSGQGASTSGSGSGSRSGSQGHEGSGSSSAPSTSALGSDHSAFRSPSDATTQRTSVSSQSSDAGPSSRAPRITYVNPSQTRMSNFPFVTTTFGATSSNSAAYSQTFQPSFTNPSQQLVLNTNPDPPPYTIVTFGAGTRSKQLDAATAASQYGAFHVPTSAFPVGSGQFLSGGFGFIGRKHGMAMDNLVEVEMVLADGRIVWVGKDGAKGGEWKEDEDPEKVWWAVRGAGAILGVVTRFRAKAYYLPSVYAGNFIFLFDRATTPSLLRHVRDCVKGAPRTLYANVIMTAGPPGAPAIVVVQLCFSGARSEGEMYIQAIGSWEGGRPLFQEFSERTFERQQLAIEEVLKGGYGRKWFIKSDMLKSLSDDVIDETCSRFHSIPDGCTWLFEFTGGGAIADVHDSCFPRSYRESAFTVAALHQWAHDEPPVEDTRCVTTAEDWINEVIHPHSPGGPLPCFLQSNDEEQVSATYGSENFSVLQKLKAKLDPNNFFRHAMWPNELGPKHGLVDGELDDEERKKLYPGGENEQHADDDEEEKREAQDQVDANAKVIGKKPLGYEDLVDGPRVPKDLKGKGRVA